MFRKSLLLLLTPAVIYILFYMWTNQTAVFLSSKVISLEPIFSETVKANGPILPGSSTQTLKVSPDQAAPEQSAPDQAAPGQSAPEQSASLQALQSPEQSQPDPSPLLQSQSQPDSLPLPDPLTPSDPEIAIRERMERIKSVCASPSRPNFHSQYFMFYFPKFQVTWQPVYKASSTTWKRFFIDQTLPPTANYKGNHYSFHLIFPYRLSGEKQERNHPGSSRQRVWKKEKNSVRFAIIRHPLSRLVSHYRKTMISPKDQAEFKDFWIKSSIILARKDKNWSVSASKKFEKEMDDMLTGKKYKASPNNPYLSLPTFPELVQFILYHRDTKKKGGMNPHWAELTKLTDVCRNDFDIVMKLEHEQSELPYVLERLNLSEFSDQLLGKANPSGNVTVAGSEVGEYLKLLTKEQQRKLNKIYELDYLMFGYEPIYA